jgi:D-alanyl-D-alanine carboxypeptidase/D-alanyl-D-alanine-endopeptidase (penicillin-binding protein 4)
VIRPRLLLGTLLAAVLVAPAPAAQAMSEGALRSRLAAEMRSAGSSSGAFVMDLDADRQLYARRPDTPYVPASVNKLFVTATALRRYGAEATLDTAVLTTGQIDPEGVLHGNLYLRGGGDPTLSSDRLAHLADQLDLTGVEGAVVGDETRFDRLRGSTNTGGALDREVGGQLGALVTARGYAGRGWQRRPAAVAADALRAALERRGVDVTGRARVGDTPPDAVELARTSSAPIADIIARTNAPSDNYLAEMLIKGLGAGFGGGGTTREGAQVVRAELAQLDVRPTIVDGSGLSRADRTNARHVVLLLDAMSEGQDGDRFLASLAVAGRTGTLDHRMRHGSAAGRCRAKTGTLHDVSALAGVCETPSGRRVGFAFLMNFINPYTARRLQDHMANAIARLTAG